MDGTNGQQAERDAQRAAINRAELIARIAEAVPKDGAVAPLPGVELRRTSTPTALGHVVSYPVLCVVAQGSKEIVLGDTSYRFDPAHYLITTAELPIASRITEASPERPYLRVLLTLDPGLVGAVLVEAGPLVPQRPLTVPAINVSPLDAELLDAVVRLVRLVDAAAEARVLAPLITREIVVRLLLGAQGGRLRQLALLGGDPNRIAVAVARLRKDYAPAVPHRGPGPRGRHERVALSPPLPGGDGAEPVAVPEAAAAARGTATDAGRRTGRHQRGRAGRLRERGALHAGVQTAVWCAADARRSTAAGRRRGAYWALRWCAAGNGRA